VGYGYDEQSQQDNTMKQALLISGMSSGSLNPVAAVALNNNPHATATDAAMDEALGGTVGTVAALGGFGGSQGQGGSPFGGRGGSSTSNLVTTLAIAGALGGSAPTPSGSGNALATVAVLSAMNNNNQRPGSSGGSSNNLLNTVVLADALGGGAPTPASSGNALATVAVLSAMNNNNQRPGPGSSSSSNNLLNTVVLADALRGGAPTPSNNAANTLATLAVLGDLNNNNQQYRG